MILINSACRVPCYEDSRLNAPALRRQNSEESKAKTIREVPILDLIRPGQEGQTYLKSLIKQKLFGHARLLMERIENELGLDGLRNYLSEQRIIESIYVLDVDRWDPGKKQVPKEFKEWITTKIRGVAAGGTRKNKRTRGNSKFRRTVRSRATKRFI
jgi:hypothetical protein